MRETRYLRVDPRAASAGRRMTRVRCDFAASFVADDGIRDAVEAAGGKLFVAPSRLLRPVRYVRFLARLIRENGYAIVHAHGNSCTLAIDLLAAKLGARAGAHRAQPQFRLPLPAAAPAAAPAVQSFVHPRDGVRHGGGAGGLFRTGRSRSSEIPSIRTRSRSIPPRANRCAQSSGWAGRWPLAAWPASCPRRTTRFCSTPSPRALKRRPDCRLVLVGNGPLRAEIEAQAESLGHRRARAVHGRARGRSPVAAGHGRHAAALGSSRDFRWSRWNGSARACRRGCPAPSRATAR